MNPKDYWADARSLANRFQDLLYSDALNDVEDYDEAGLCQLMMLLANGGSWQDVVAFVAKHEEQS